MPLRKNLGFNGASGNGSPPRDDHVASIALDDHEPASAQATITRRYATVAWSDQKGGSRGSRADRNRPGMKSARGGSGGRIRTTDQGLMSPLLYH
jgi:hypothetical protein